MLSSPSPSMSFSVWFKDSGDNYTFYVERKLVKPMDRIIDAMEDRNNHYFIEEDETDELAVIYKRYNQVISHVEELSRENMEMKYQARLAGFRPPQNQNSINSSSFRPSPLSSTQKLK